MNGANAEGGTAHGSHSGQWGLASLLLAGLVLLFFPLMIFLLFAAMTGAYEDPFVTSSDIDLGVTAVYLLAGSVLGLAVFALVCGVIGLLSGWFRRQAAGLAVAGTVTSLVAVAVAIILLLVALRCVEWVRALQKARFGPAGIRRPTPEQLQ
jgi:hypothetical protein